MKISEMINQLQDILKEEGDIPVLIRMYEYDTEIAGKKKKILNKDQDLYHGTKRVFVDKDINKFLGTGSDIAVIE